MFKILKGTGSTQPQKFSGYKNSRHSKKDKSLINQNLKSMKEFNVMTHECHGLSHVQAEYGNRKSEIKGLKATEDDESDTEGSQSHDSRSNESSVNCRINCHRQVS